MAVVPEPGLLFKHFPSDYIPAPSKGAGYRRRRTCARPAILQNRDNWLRPALHTGAEMDRTVKSEMN
jgi:hypothetical protein